MGRERRRKKRFSNHLKLENVKIETTHRVGDSNVTTKRTIVAKLASFKDKQKILTFFKNFNVTA